MKRLSSGVGLAITAMACAAAAVSSIALALTASAPLVHVEQVHPVSEHVQVIPDNSVGGVPNVGFIIGSKAVLVVDTGLGPMNGAAVAATAQRLAPRRAIWLVATHAHPEHDMGAQAFPPGTRFIRSREQSADADNDRKVAQMFAQRSSDMAELLEGAQFRAADVSFDKSYELDLGGGVRAALFAMGSNHTDGDTIIWIPGDRVLFSGDLAMKAQPVLGTNKSSIAHWQASLDRMAALHPKIVVPSHGPIGDAAFIGGYRAYLREVADRTASAKTAGKSLDVTINEVSEAMAPRYPDRGRLAGAVRIAYGS